MCVLSFHFVVGVQLIPHASWELESPKYVSYFRRIFVVSADLVFPDKNLKTRCDGLSPALFFFAIFGNATYALSICAKSMDEAYLITNSGWLAGNPVIGFS